MLIPLLESDKVIKTCYSRTPVEFDKTVKLTENDGSTSSDGVFLVGPEIQHGEAKTKTCIARTLKNAVETFETVETGL